MKKIKFWIAAVVILMTLNSCNTFNEGMVGSKRSKSGDEFLVYKKKPLVVPPDFELMPSPKPLEKKKVKMTESDESIESLLKTNKEENIGDFEKGSDDSLEKSILKKIKTN
tara:strand:+ start:5125 stop:5457 length:333 start_codon:yes stop_codon:yes gene_type:complete